MSNLNELTLEKRAINHITSAHMKTKRTARYIALENIEIDFVWDERDVVGIDKLWKMGYSIHFIAAEFERPINDVFALLWDRLERGFIQERPGWLFGKEAGNANISV